MKMAEILSPAPVDRDAVQRHALVLIGNWTSKGHEAGWTLGGRNMDSLDIVELTMAVEDQWDVGIPDELWHHDTTVDQVVADVLRIVCDERST